MNRTSGKPEEKTDVNKLSNSVKDDELGKTENQADKTPDITVDIDISLTRKVSNDDLDLQISHKKLQEAIIWSELLGKPVCKRRKKKIYGN